MRRQLVHLCVLILAGGCATQEKTRSGPVTDAKLGLEYATVPQSLKTMDSRGDCPRQAGALKGRTWKQYVAGANACIQAGQWKMVETIGQDMAQTHHLVPWGAYYLSLAAEHRGELPRAMWMAELALKKSPGNGLLIYHQGRLYWHNKDQAAALKSFKKATDIDNRLAEAQLVLGQMALLAAQTDEAAKRFQAALNSEPRNVAALFGLAEAKIKKNDGKGANEALAQAILLQPSSYKARVRQAHVLENIEKNFPEALAAYRRIRTMARDKKLDAMVDFDIDSKITQLEGATKEPAANQLSLRDPAKEKKGGK